MNRSPQDEELVASDDAAIGRAFWLSLAAFGALALAGAGVWYGLNREEAPVEIRAAQSTARPVVRSETAPAAVPGIQFTDVTATSGVDFVHENGARGDKLLPETMGSGAAFLDYDADGDQDLLLVNATRWPDDPRAAGLPTLALYRNDGAGRFENVTEAAGLGVSLYGMGAAVGDVDNDGFPDLFITALGPNHFFHNRGGAFVETTGAAGLAGESEAWSTGAAFVDVDSDGDLDVLVTQSGGAPRLLRNDHALGHHWLRVRLIGRTVNRDAIGAWVELEAGGVAQRRQVMPTRSYLSQVELPITFGLGETAGVERLTVLWPDGSVQRLDGVPVDTLLVIEQPEAAAL